MKTFLLTLFISALPFAGKAQEQFTLILSDFTIKDNGKEMKIQDEIVRTVRLDELVTLPIYENDNYTFLTQFEVGRSGSRIKLKQRNQIIDKSGAVVKNGKWKKSVQFLKISVTNEIKGTSGESMLIDKATFKSIAAYYKHKLIFGT